MLLKNRPGAAPASGRPFFLALAALLGAVVFLLAAGNAFAQNSDDGQSVPGEYIVKYNQDKIGQLKHAIPGLGDYSNEQIEGALTVTMGAAKVEDLDLIAAQTIKAPSGSDIDIDAAIDLIDAELIDYIAPNFIHTASIVPNDPSFSSLWGMHQLNDVDINAPEAWDVT